MFQEIFLGSDFWYEKCYGLKFDCIAELYCCITVVKQLAKFVKS